MPEVSEIFGIIIRVFYAEHGLPHFRAKYSGNKTILISEGAYSKTAFSQELGGSHVEHE